jgi:hypothetical protein
MGASCIRNANGGRRGVRRGKGGVQIKQRSAAFVRA